MAGSRFSLEGEIYEMVGPEYMSLRLQLMLKTDPANEIIDLSFGNFSRLADQFNSLMGRPREEFTNHPEALEMLAITLYLAMVKKRQDSGDMTYLPFQQVLDANLGTFKMLPEPGDRQGKATPRKGQARKTTTGSGPRSAPTSKATEATTT